MYSQYVRRRAAGRSDFDLRSMETRGDNSLSSSLGRRSSTIHPTPPPPLYLDFLFSCIHLCRSESLACLSNVRPSEKVRWAEDGETGHSSSAAMRRVPLCVARKDIYRISGPKPSSRLSDLPPPPCNRTTCTRSRPATCRSLHPCISHNIEGYDRPSG